MDALRVGRSLRVLRIRRGWRQQDVADAAGISRSTYARAERGELARGSIGDLVMACRVLGADLDVRVRWRGEGLDRLLDAEHAELVNRIVKLLRGEGWQVAVEVSFNVYGERGSVDVIGWKPEARALLIVEAKSVIPDAQAMVSGLDRKARLAPTVVHERGWLPAVVGRLLVVRDSSASRQRVAAVGEVFRAAYPDRAMAIRRWIRQPIGLLSGLAFLRIDRGVSAMQRTVGRQRVRSGRSHDSGG